MYFAVHAFGLFCIVCTVPSIGVVCLIPTIDHRHSPVEFVAFFHSPALAGCL